MKKISPQKMKQLIEAHKAYKKYEAALAELKETIKDILPGTYTCKDGEIKIIDFKRTTTDIKKIIKDYPEIEDNRKYLKTSKSKRIEIRSNNNEGE